MIDGITILNQYEVTTHTSAEIDTVAFGITFISIIVICSLVAFFVTDCDSEGAILGLLVGIALGAFIGLVVAGMCNEPSKIETTMRYEVIVDDSVSITEFYEYYDVIEKRGEIFIVEEKSSE